MESEEIRKKFLEFFRERGHVIVPSSSLMPDDPSVLLTTAGMQQFRRYFTGELDAQKDFGGKNTVSIQKCFRTSDIDEVGDKTHLTFFEMLGHFSFGGYFKKETIEWTYQLLTEAFGVQPERISATVFTGDEAVAFDKESFDAWSKFLSHSKIRKGQRKDNFWGPAGSEGPCGAANEVYVDDMEVATLVFMEFYCLPDKTLKPLPKKGVDVGWGFERIVKVTQGVENVFQTDIFELIIKKINEIAPHLKDREVRVFADHLRAAIFLTADGVRPSNKEAGYILRRLLRRTLAYQIKYDIHADLFSEALKFIKDKFGPFYLEVKKTQEIGEVFEGEKNKFQKAIAAGLFELKKRDKISAQDAFYLYETFGLPFELIKELAPPGAVKDLEDKDFEKEFKKHQEISRAGAEKKFGGHGLLFNTGELKAKDEEELKKVTRLHTATHLLQAALRKILGPEVKQMGSDITVERTRFDFTFSRKLTQEEIKKAENLVNEVIQKDLPVGFVEMPLEEAKKTGALHFFSASSSEGGSTSGGGGEKYPERVKVYYVGHSLKDAFSKEFCGGPHVGNTLVIGKFKIIKEEAVGAGARRIRAAVFP